MQVDRKRTHGQSNPTVAAGSTADKIHEVPPQHHAKRKRHTRPNDDIDELFDTSFGKKVKKAALGPESESAPIATKSGDDRGALQQQKDQGLERILGAIRSAPKVEKVRGKKKHK